MARLSGYCDLLQRRAGVVLAVAVLILLGAALLASRLALRTNFAELLPSGDSAVVALERLARNLNGTSVLQLAVEGPDRAANLAVADALTQRLRTLPPEVLASATYEIRAERQFFLDRRWLYVPEPDLQKLRDAVSARLHARTNPLYVDLEDDDPAKLLDEARARAGKLDRFPDGVFANADGTLVVIVCRPPGGPFAEGAGERLEAAARRAVAELTAGSPHPGVTIGFTGDVMNQLEERAALERDLVRATAVSSTLVCLVVVLFFGRLRALPFVGLPALGGVAVAFAAAELAFGYLNASTAFLGSIVLGNGINYPIILLARYEEERLQHPPREAIEIALRATWRPTAVAAFAAALAYGSLLVTRFRGFSQFGVIGAVGMVAAWLATLTLLPALLLVFDRRERTLRRFGAPGGGRIASAVARVVTRWPRACLALCILTTVLSLVPLRRYLADPFEYDFRNLRNRRSLESGAGALAPRVDALFGLTITPSVVLAERREQTGEIRDRLLDKDRRLPGRPMLGQVSTLEDFLPGDAATQARKLALLADLRRLVDSPAMTHASDEDRRLARELRPPESLRPVSDADLPAEVRRPFTERDGTLGRIVLVYHAAWVSVWDGRQLARLADVLDPIPLSDGTQVRSSGQAVVFTAMLRSILHDAPRATLASFLGVALLVLVLAGRGGLPVLAVLLAGVAWMVGAAAWLGVRTNFLNFIALPITFGIGVDYGINLHSRFVADGDLLRAIRATGGAVALCSLTTILGYGALLVADNQALQSFGTLAILGEVACLTAAIGGLPAWLQRHLKQ